jgi:ribonuclease HI
MDGLAAVVMMASDEPDPAWKHVDVATMYRKEADRHAARKEAATAITIQWRSNHKGVPGNGRADG